jgi:hypothetical protein
MKLLHNSGVKRHNIGNISGLRWDQNKSSVALLGSLFAPAILSDHEHKNTGRRCEG